MVNKKTRKKKTSWLRYFVKLILVFALLLLAISVAAVGALRWVDPPLTAFMLQHKLSSNVPLRHQWVPTSKISQHIAIAAVASEDQKFPYHHGFDVDEIQSAIKDRIRGKRLRGASTITQQVAKNIFLWREKSLLRKSVEAYFTVLIELLWAKPRILEVYLNIAEFGPGIYGVESASRYYFKKSAWQLNIMEASRLVAILPNPAHLKLKPPSDYVKQRANEIQRQVKQLGGFKYLNTN